MEVEEEEVKLDKEKSEQGWVDTNALRRVGVELAAATFGQRATACSTDRADCTDMTLNMPGAWCRAARA